MANRATPRQAGPPVHLDAARRELRAAVHRLNELQEMTEAGPSRRGCCDDCHQEPVDLYDDPDEPDAGWQYCRPCLDRRRQSNKVRIARAQAQCRALGGSLCRACADFYDPSKGSCGCAPG